MTDFYDDVARSGGSWVKLNEKGDTISGVVMSIDVLERTDPEGNVVKSRKTDKPRKIYRLRFVIPEAERDGGDDDGIRIFDANESAKSAIIRAFKECGESEVEGLDFWLKVSAERETPMSQLGYEAKFKKGAGLPAAAVADEEPPF